MSRHATFLVAHLAAVAVVASSELVSIPPAVQHVPNTLSSTGAAYFPYESQQLTGSVLNNLTSYLDSINTSYAGVFGFAADSNTSSSLLSSRSSRSCKLLPGDSQWPSTLLWDVFDLLLGGRLIKGVPAAAPCYQDWPQYDEAVCAEIQASWEDPAWMAEQPTGVDWPINEGMSCLAPGLGEYVSRDNSSCSLGGLSSYIVNVTNVAQIQLALNFARNQNLRLVVKNSGHDFNAKSTGAGALSIWTHYLNDIEYLGSDYKSSTGDTGHAFKLGSGVSTEQIYDAADARGLMVIGGIARTIGIAGGYVAGGGNGPLVNKYGMAADQVLSMEVVLPDGSFVTADSKTNSDLFFALRGGGGGTWGVVTSIVIRAYESEAFTALTYTFGSGLDEDTFWAGIDVFWSYFPTWPESNIWSYFTISCTDAADCSLSMDPALAVGMNATEFETSMAPFFANLSTLGIQVNTTYTEYASYLDMFEGLWPLSTSTCSYWYFHSTSRLFPKSNWDNATQLAKQAAIIRNTTQTRGTFIGYNAAPAANAGVDQANAVNPAWREALLFAQTNVVYDTDASFAQIAAANEEMVDALQPWRDITPGTYLNEADINEPDFQQAFYGSHYARLYALKQKVDPWGLMYAIGGVGSEEWYTTGQLDYYPTTNGRLCPV